MLSNDPSFPGDIPWMVTPEGAEVLFSDALFNKKQSP